MTAYGDGNGNTIAYATRKILEPTKHCLYMSVDSLWKKVSTTYKEKHQTKFEPTQISLCKDIDFEADDFKSMSDFQQTIVFTGISPNEDKSKFIVWAKIVAYNSIEDAEFIILDNKLATVFRKNLKPYHSIKGGGYINVEKDVEEVSEDDCWGEGNKMDKNNSPTVRELIISGADPTSIEKEVYSEEALDSAIATINASKQANKDYGSSNSKDEWGSVNSKSDLDADDDSAW